LGGGFLGSLGFIDFAGSTAMHAVGGFLALSAVLILGPRIGKYTPSGKSKIIYGHSLTLGALWVFILWFGFNGRSTFGITGDNTLLVGHVFATTNIAAAAGGLSALIYTWIKDKHASIGATLNGILAGLMGITAGAHVISEVNAIFVGLLSGVLVSFAVETLDKKLKIDDPVGAISVHGIAGVAGTIMVGLFHATEWLLTTGQFELLGIQTLGTLVVSTIAFVSGLVFIFLLNKVIPIRVTKQEELEGLDIHENKTSSYPNFTISKDQIVE
jgi:Amt family ammonium transporter